MQQFKITTTAYLPDGSGSENSVEYEVLPHDEIMLVSDWQRLGSVEHDDHDEHGLVFAVYNRTETEYDRSSEEYFEVDVNTIVERLDYGVEDIVS